MFSTGSEDCPLTAIFLVAAPALVWLMFALVIPAVALLKRTYTSVGDTEFPERVSVTDGPKPELLLVETSKSVGAVTVISADNPLPETE
jgi:hypothetical protein